MKVKVRGAYESQHQALTDLRPGWCGFFGGWGCGKSIVGAQKTLVFHNLNKRSWSCIIAPSAVIGTTIRTIIRVLKKWKINYEYHPQANKQVKFPHLLVQGRPILLISADKPESITGFEVGFIWVDEAGRVSNQHSGTDRNAWTQMVGRLRCPFADYKQIFLSSTHEGRATFIYKHFYEEPSEMFRHYVGSTYDNPVLKPEDIELIKQSIPAGMEEQYLKGEAVDFTDTPAHPAFTTSHIKTKAPGDGVYYLGCDFNVSPMTWLWAEMNDGHLHVHDEFIMKNNARVDLMVRAVHDRGWSQRPLKICIDKSGLSRSVVGESAWNTLKAEADKLGWEYDGLNLFKPNGEPRANIHVRDRINLVNRRIMSADGSINFSVDPTCTELISKLRSTPLTNEGKYFKDKTRDPHILDALGYVFVDIYGYKLPTVTFGEYTAA